MNFAQASALASVIADDAAIVARSIRTRERGFAPDWKKVTDAFARLDAAVDALRKVARDG